MNDQERSRETRRKARKKTQLGVALALVLAAAAAVGGLFSARYIATTMRLVNAVGEVEIQDNAGNARAAMENVRFQSGEAMRTGEESLASISLDSSKIITMDENSRVEFKKRLNHIELFLTEGGLLFDVSRKLRDNETFDIRTSTMAVGIRGTIGYVYVDPETQETTLWMLESVCEVVGINPVTRETKTTSVRAGQKVHTYLYNDRKIDSIMFEIEEFTWEDLPKDVQEIIESDSVEDNLYMRVMGACGWADDSSGEAAGVQPKAAAESQEVQGWTPIPEAEEIQEEETSQGDEQAEEESIVVDEQKEEQPASGNAVSESLTEDAPAQENPADKASPVPVQMPAASEPAPTGPLPAPGITQDVPEGTGAAVSGLPAPADTAGQGASLAIVPVGPVPEQKAAEPAQESYAENAPVPSQPEETAEQQAAPAEEHNHQFVMKSGVAASCTSSGRTLYTCECGESLTTKTDALGHLLTLHIAVEATCSSEGNTEYWTCSRCGKYFSDASGIGEITEASVKTPKGSHSLVHHEAAEATCEAEGNTEYWTCSVCGKYFSDAAGSTETTADAVKTPKGSHSLVHHEAAAATCEAQGNTEYWTCSVCGKYFSDAAGSTETTAEAVKTAKGSHSLVNHPAVQATCTAEGNTEYWTCNVCGKYFSDAAGSTETTEDAVKTQKAAHSLVHHEAAEATCMAEGNTEYWTCSVCGKYFSDASGSTETTADAVKTAKAAHTLEHHAAVEATCEAEGNTEYWTCNVCEKFFADAEGKEEIGIEDTVVAAAHDWVEQERDEWAGESDYAYRIYYKCSRCDQMKEDICCGRDGAVLDLVDPDVSDHPYASYHCPECEAYYSDDLTQIYYESTIVPK